LLEGYLLSIQLEAIVGNCHLPVEVSDASFFFRIELIEYARYKVLRRFLLLLNSLHLGLQLLILNVLSCLSFLNLL